MNCLTCKKLDTCTTLCQECKDDVDSVEVQWREAKPDSIYLYGEHLRIFNTDTGADKPLLTYREWQIMNAKNIGFNSTDIAKKLGISPVTVRRHLQNARRKGVHAVHNECRGL